MTAEAPAVAVVGAGLAGSLMAIYLARAGYGVNLFERGTDPRVTPPAEGRSINLALAERGRRALAEVGLLQAVDEFALPMAGRQMHYVDRDDEFQHYGIADDEVIYSVHRAKLNRCLLEAARAEPSVRCWFSHRLIAVDPDQQRAEFASSDKAGSHWHDFDFLIAADGAGSHTRRALEAAGHVQVNEALLDHGYKEFHLPPGPDGDFILSPKALHIWPRGDHMLIALPNPDRSFTMTLFLPNSKPGDQADDHPPGFAQLQNRAQQQAFLARWYPDLPRRLPEVFEQFEHNPVGILGTVYCQPWQVDGRILLIGDAAHAIVPFHGQGMNAAFEDCRLLNQLIEDSSGLEAAFRTFSDSRKADADAIATMALENYQIMREAVAEPAFLQRKALEHELERRFPDRFVGRYGLVMFHHLPYAESLHRGAIQADILSELMETVSPDIGSDGVISQIDFERAGRLVEQKLAAVTPTHA